MFPIDTDGNASTTTRRRPVFRTFLSMLGLVLGLFVPALFGAQAASASMSTVESTISSTILTMMNVQRSYHHLPGLRSSSALRISARKHDLAMAAANTMSHQLPGEPNFCVRIENAGYNWTWAGENIAWNSTMTLAGVKNLQSMMYKEVPPNDGHRLNILSSHFKNVGIDILMDYKHHKVWMTEDFGSL